MLRLFIIIILFLSGAIAQSFASVNDNNYRQDLQHANELYDADDKESAKKYYEKAAEQGSAEADFMLSYRYILPEDQTIFHYARAARKGHEGALEGILEYIFFCPSSLEIANPQMALEIYNEAKSVNPSLKLYNEEETVEVLKMSAEPGEFRAKEFIEKYAIQLSKGSSTCGHSFDIWELAEEASIGGRFGKPDPKLILQLASRGGCVHQELISAVKETYKNWKAGVVKEFNICDHITSGCGGTFCALRQKSQHEKENLEKLQNFSQGLTKEVGPFLDKAYESTNKFIEEKTIYEEMHGGTAAHAEAINSSIQQQSDYLELITKISKGFKPQSANTLQKIDQELNSTYAKVIQKTKQLESSVLVGLQLPNIDEVRAVQRLWIISRDDNAKLFSILNPSVSNEVWKTWLTELRELQLKDFIEKLEEAIEMTRSLETTD
jgi:uncharacterized protein YecT (DUF1311 family)